LRGDKFDGHDFVGNVIAQSVPALILDEKRVPPGLGNTALITVADTRRALGLLAARYRSDFKLRLVAVGGSNGKTTTKELIAAVLRRKFGAVWSEASFNNDIGVPLTLLKLEERHAAAVLEIGTNHPGELAPLVRMAQPDIGVITNIGREHLEFFGDLTGVAEEEGMLAELLPANGVLFINGDSEWAAALAERSRARVVRVGSNAGNNWRGTQINVKEDGVSFFAEAPDPLYSGFCSLRLLGAHQVTNSLLALAVGAELGIAPEEIREALAQVESPKMRLQLWEANGVRVIDDSYNANADSMLAALQTLQDLPCTGRRIAVLGDMAELGEQTERAHEEIGRRAGELLIDRLFTVGRCAETTATAALSAGLDHVSVFENAESLMVELKHFVRSGDIILVKGSRAAGLEKVGAALRKQ
jgi:UDP-N-acetylmuramoyl-tripeptide--D-alanyl-D-alanine ligase